MSEVVWGMPSRSLAGSFGRVGQHGKTRRFFCWEKKKHPKYLNMDELIIQLKAVKPCACNYYELFKRYDRVILESILQQGADASVVMTLCKLISGIQVQNR